MKNYCVHVYERKEYAHNLAANASEAEDKIITEEYAGDYDDISEVQVMVECGKCGCDNEPDAAICDDCGEPITEVEAEQQPTNP